MSSSIHVLCIDPGFANVGWAILRVFSKRAVVDDVGLIETSKLEKKKGVFAAADLTRRSKHIASELRLLASTIDIHDCSVTPAVSAICVEAFSALRSAMATAQLSRCLGLIDMLSVFYRLSLIEVDRRTWQHALMGHNRKVTKRDIAQAVEAKIKIGRRAQQSLKAIPTGTRKPGEPGRREHIFDAMAIGIACLESNELKMAQELLAVRDGEQS